MEGTQVKASARLAVVVRNFLGSRLERELLARAFALAVGGAAARDDAAVGVRSSGCSPGSAERSVSHE